MCAALLVITSSVFAAASVNDAPDTSSSFFENSEEGWFWYKDENSPEPEHAPENLPPSSSAPAPQGAPAFSVAWLRDNIPRYRDLAIDNPSVENVRAFLMIQRIMLDKAENFARMMQAVVVGDELIDEAARRGLSTFAGNELDREAAKGKTNLLKLLSERVGIFFFFDSSCSYCKVQIPILQQFKNTYDFAVLGISKDGKSLDTNFPFDWRSDQGLAEKFAVDQFPALVLVTPEGDAAKISQGLLSLTEIQSRVILAAKKMAWVSEEEFNTTLPLTNPQRNDLAAALDAKTDYAKKVVQSYQSEDGFITPDKLIRLVTTRAKVTNTSLSNARALEHAAKEVDSLKELSKTPKELTDEN